MTEPIRFSKRLIHASFLAAAIAVASGPTAAAPDPVELVAQADAARFPQTSFQVNIDIESQSAEGSAPESRRYRVLSKGNDDTVILTMEPVSERGQILLMHSRNLWIFMPAVSQPVRLSLAQRLTGQVANGDLARANFAGDYTPTYWAKRPSMAISHMYSSSTLSMAASPMPKSNTGFVQRTAGRSKPSSMHFPGAC